MVDSSQEKEKEEWSLTKHQVKYIDKRSKFSLSPTFGKKDPLVVRGIVIATDSVVMFFSNLLMATKTIIKEIM